MSQVDRFISYSILFVSPCLFCCTFCRVIVLFWYSSMSTCFSCSACTTTVGANCIWCPTQGTCTPPSNQTCDLHVDNTFGDVISIIAIIICCGHIINVIAIRRKNHNKNITILLSCHTHNHQSNTRMAVLNTLREFWKSYFTEVSGS